MPNGRARLVELLDLEPIEVNIFRGETPGNDKGRVYGGQVAAQALAAAGRTVERGVVHSLHSYFLRPGDPSIPILYEVDRIRDGRSFTTRRVVAVQRGEAIFNLQCSFHRGEEGFEHQEEMPAAPAPEDLEPHALRTDVPGLIAADGLDLRFSTDPATGHVQIWMRSHQPLGDDPLLHACVFTFASDLGLVPAILAVHGRTIREPGFLGASLDHCMWFHRPLRMDEWLLYDQKSPVAANGRGLGEGRLFTRPGVLVASVVQEGLLRFRRDA